MTRVVVTGGRDYADESRAFRALDATHAEQDITLLIHGDAAGLDSIAKRWAETNGVPVKGCPADWDNIDVHSSRCVIRVNRFKKPYNALAGINRNQSMIDDEQPELGIVFPGGRGTADMRKRLKRARIPIIDIA